MSKIKSSSLESKHGVKLDSEELDATSARAAINSGPSCPDFANSMATFWHDSTIFQTASQLSKSVANLNELLSEERGKCHRLMQENLDLQSFAMMVIFEIDHVIPWTMNLTMEMVHLLCTRS